MRCGSQCGVYAVRAGDGSGGSIENAFRIALLQGVWEPATLLGATQQRSQRVSTPPIRPPAYLSADPLPLQRGCGASQLQLPRHPEVPADAGVPVRSIWGGWWLGGCRGGWVSMCRGVLVITLRGGCLVGGGWHVHLVAGYVVWWWGMSCVCWAGGAYVAAAARCSQEHCRTALCWRRWTAEAPMGGAAVTAHCCGASTAGDPQLSVLSAAGPDGPSTDGQWSCVG